MTTGSSGAKFMPLLAAALVLLVGGALALVWTGSEPARPATGAVTDKLMQAQAAIARGRQAINGDLQALKSLPEVATQLQSARAGLPSAEAAAVEQTAAAIAVISADAEVIRTVQRAAEDLDSLVSALTDQVYGLDGAMTVQRQPVVTAQLERLRLLAEGIRRDVRGLAGGADPNAVSQSLLDAEMGIAQIVRGFSEGDPGLGLRAVSENAELEALAAIERSAGLIAERVRDVAAVGDRLSALARARLQLDEQAAVLVAAPKGISTATAGNDDRKLLIAGLLGAALLAFIGMAVIYLRSASLRRTAAIQAEQTERNQQAIMRLLDELSSLADGDLTVQATVTEDITGAIADSINYAIEALRDLVTTLNDSAIMVDGAARQTDVTAQQLAEASASQSKQIAAASEAIARMTSSIEEVSGNAERSSDVARHSVDVAHKGSDAVRRTIHGMNTIRETIQDTSKRIKRLGESSQEIGNIVELINDIADQTNILALNASIQASMAGAAGRGFAVVADEVQRLAERSANATKQIEVLVRTIQADTNEAVVSMERSTTDVVGGALLAENAGAALEEIEQVSNQIALLVQNISDSAREQAGAADAVTRNMDVLQQINSETASSTSETTDSIRKLAELAAQLRESVSGFRLPEADDSETIGDDAADTAADLQESEDIVPDSVTYADQRTA